jgi:hypothetical protein
VNMVTLLCDWWRWCHCGDKDVIVGNGDGFMCTLQWVIGSVVIVFAV